jgi:hypothetical protein
MTTQQAFRVDLDFAVLCTLSMIFAWRMRGQYSLASSNASTNHW